VLLPQSFYKQVTALLAIAWLAEEAHCQNIVPDGTSHVKHFLNYYERNMRGLKEVCCSKDAN
jgi:hypothetical protein